MNLLPRWAKSKALQALALGLASGLLVLGADRLGWLNTLENKSLDWRFRTFTQPERANHDIVIIALDDTSFDSQDMIDNFGRWPWRRQLYAGLVHYLHEWGARVIALDLMFQGADPHPGDDSQLAVALTERPDVVLAFALNRGTFRTKDPRAQEMVRQRLAPFALQVEQGGTLNLRAYSGIDLPQEELLRAVHSIGCITVLSDSDGPVRSVTPLFRFGDKLYPSFPLAVAALATRQSPTPELSLGPGTTLNFGGRHVPLDREGRMLVRWYGPAYTYEHYSVWKVFNSALAYEEGRKPLIPTESFKGKIVLIGATATGASDLRPTAFSENFPGVEIHATVIDNLLKGDFIRACPSRVAMISILAMAFLLAGVVYLFTAALIYTLLAVLGTLAYLAVACGLFRGSGLWVPLVSPLTAGLVAFTGSTLTRYATEGREKRKYRKTLLKYLSP